MKTFMPLTFYSGKKVLFSPSLRKKRIGRGGGEGIRRKKKKKEEEKEKDEEEEEEEEG
jgi:hypothetical protein